MIIEELTVTAFQQHTRIVGCEKTRRAICIDPGDDSESIADAFEQPPKIDEYLEDGQVYPVGELNFTIIHCPGHTPGHVVLFEPQERKVFVGDVLFAGSVGRTDLPGGSTEQLMDSIINKLLPLGDDVEVYSGHGPVTTIGQERRTNPFLTGVYNAGAGRL